MTAPRHVLLCIFPHPDDEAYTAAGTMAKAAADGVDVYLLCATAGEAGHVLFGGEHTQDEVGALRRQELAGASRALGINPPRFLGYRDGILPAVDMGEAVGRIVRIIRELRPDVVVTMGPDGVYGHPDHVALHKLVTPAFRSAGGGSRFPEEEFGPLHQPQRLFWTAYLRGHFRPVWERLLTSDLAEGIRQFHPDRLGVGEDEFHAVVDVSAFVPDKLAAMRAHRSQITGDDPLSIFPPGILEPLLSTERFTLAFGSRPPGMLTDLFEGLS